MKILKYILLAIAWLGSEQIASSQYYLKLKSDSVSLESDSALIFIDEYRGVINWQASSDLVNWLSLNKNNDTLGVRIDSSAYYRATIIEGNCNPVMSDTAFLIEKVTTTGSNQFTVDSLGGVFLLPNGIKVKIPKGAVTEPGEIKLDILGFDDANALSDINISENTTFLSGISFSTDLFDFSKSIKIKIPLQNIDKTGLPIMYELQNENSTWFFSDETLIVSPEDKFIEVILKASVQKGSHAKKGSKGSLNDVRSFFLKLYGDIFLSEDKCRTKGYKIISENIDYSAGQGCDAVRVHEDIVYNGCDPEQSGGSVGLVLSSDCEPKLTIMPEGEKKVKKGESLPITLSTSISGFRLSDQKININTSPNLNVLSPLIFTDSNGDKSFDVTGIAAGNGEITLSVSYDYFLTTVYASSNEEMEYQEYDNVKINKDYTINVTVYDVPEVSTAISSDIACTTETVGGNVISDGGDTVTERGVFWGTSQNPELTGTKVPLGNGTGNFSFILSDLTPNKTYYVKAYATNLAGTGYGIQNSFSTSDMDNKVLVRTIAKDSTCSTFTSWTIVSTDEIESVTDRGAYFGKYPDPELTGKKVSFGTQVEPVDTLPLKIIGIQPETIRYVRGYATTECGTVYGNQVIYTPENLSTITDIDGNVYPVVTIGTQVWMAENLKTTKYNDGTIIPLVVDKYEWSDLEHSTKGAYCWYLNDKTYKNIYGALYNWWTVGTGKLCPTGWHVPNYDEWTTLINFVGGETVAGGKLKEVGTLHWNSPNEGATNEVCFTALPGNSRLYSGLFSGEGHWGNFWSSTETYLYFARFLVIYNNETRAGLSNFRKNDGYSVRCIKND